MKRILRGGAVLIGQIAVIDGLYYLGMTNVDSWGTGADVVVFFLPCLGAFALYTIPWGCWDTGRGLVSRGGRLAASLLVTLFGLFLALVIGANAWGV